MVERVQDFEPVLVNGLGMSDDFKIEISMKDWHKRISI